MTFSPKNSNSDCATCRSRPISLGELKNLPGSPSCDRFLSVTVAGFWGEVHGTKAATGDPGRCQVEGVLFLLCFVFCLK